MFVTRRIFLLTICYLFYGLYTLYIGTIELPSQLSSPSVRQSGIFVVGAIPLVLAFALWFLTLALWLPSRSIGAHGFAVITQVLCVGSAIILTVFSGLIGTLFLISSALLLYCLLDKNTCSLFR
jgi:hypothetical protein